MKLHISFLFPIIFALRVSIHDEFLLWSTENGFIKLTNLSNSYLILTHFLALLLYLKPHATKDKLDLWYDYIHYLFSLISNWVVASIAPFS